MGNIRDELQHALGTEYRLADEISGGGMARVFAADEVATGRRVAIKVLPHGLTLSAGLDRFRREIQLASQLQHPNIVPVLRADQSGELAYYIMPFTGHETLRTRMKATPQLTLADTLRFAEEIGGALGYAHAQNVVHRDIKPENILIQDGHALVADFGIARAIERTADIKSVTSTGLTLGTPMYMSPEQATASKHIDGRSDIYSFACVLYEMLSGDPPFVSDNVRTIVAKHLQEPPPSVRTARPDLPAHVDRALRTALAKAPADRFATVADFLLALTNPDTAIPVAPTAASRRGARWIGVGVAVLVVAGWALWPKAAMHADTVPLRIAVLPFHAPDGDTALAVFSRALNADLIDVLHRAPGLAPLSHEAMRSLPATIGLDSLRTALGAAMIVAGDIERRGDSIRVTARITDAITKIDLRSGSVRAQFARAMVLQLRDTVVEQVGRRILAEFGREALLREWRTEARSPQAWELRQNAQDLIDRAPALPQPQTGFAPQLAVLARADTLLAAASAADPAWSDPYIARGWLRSQRAMYEGPEMTGVEFIAAESLANVVLARRPNDAAAMELRGTVRSARWRALRSGSDALRDSAEADLRAALRLDGGLTRAWQSLAAMLNTHGDTTGAAEATRRASESDPYSLALNRTLMTVVMRHLYARHPDSARTACAQARAQFPDDAIIRTCQLTVLGWAGKGARDVDRAWSELDWHERAGPFALDAGVYPVGRFWIATILARGGLRDSARAVADSTHARLQRAGLADRYPINEAQVLLALGDRAAALARLEQAALSNGRLRQDFARNPWFDDLRGDPRFMRMLVPR